MPEADAVAAAMAPTELEAEPTDLEPTQEAPPAQRFTVVKGLADLFEWPKRCWALHSDLESAAERLSNASVSTAFSGIDAPGTGMHMLCAELGTQLGHNVPAPRHIFAVEWDRESQCELQVHPGKPTSLVTDMHGFYTTQTPFCPRTA